jgi:hypothetical protein
MGYSPQQEETKKDPLAMMQKHPNYKKPVPIPGETKTQFILRAASHLVSPPMEEDESYETECIYVAQGIRALEPELEKAWNKSIKKKK